MTNKRLLLAKRPVGLPEADTWTLEESAIPEVQNGQILVQQQYISLDPAMRGWMNKARSYIPPVEIGAVMRAGSVGQVTTSKHPDFAVGDYVMGWGGVQQYAVSEPKGWFKVDLEIDEVCRYIRIGLPVKFLVFEYAMRYGQ